MPIPELIDYVRSQTQEGTPADSLRVALMEAGWQELDIDNALHDVAAGLHPVTPGASIHEDLAQVRGMVAHLATRLKGVEARLASIPVQARLPTAFIGADHELSGKSGKKTAGKIISVMVLTALAVLLGMYATDLVRRNALAPRDHIIIAVAVGAFLMISAVVFMRLGRAWTATLLTAVSLTLWTGDALISWRIYHYIQWPVALTLGILFIVIAVVMSIWIKRMSR